MSTDVRKKEKKMKPTKIIKEKIRPGKILVGTY